MFCVWEWKGAKLPIVPSKFDVEAYYAVDMVLVDALLLSVYIQARYGRRCLYHDVYQVGRIYEASSV